MACATLSLFTIWHSDPYCCINFNDSKEKTIEVRYRNWGFIRHWLVWAFGGIQKGIRPKILCCCWNSPNERKSLYGYGEYILFQRVQILGDGNFSYSSIIGVNLSCCMLYFSWAGDCMWCKSTRSWCTVQQLRLRDNKTAINCNYCTCKYWINKLQGATYAASYWKYVHRDCIKITDKCSICSEQNFVGYFSTEQSFWFCYLFMLHSLFLCMISSTNILIKTKGS